MGRIRVLPDPVINRIAAGEVVERPASVVKELVENSLDAGATSIEVHLVAGGRESIRVDDDGTGMDRDDALLALERHATSKLASAADLEGIATLGFRGEALASIAAVSKMLLRTATGDGPGTEVEIHGGAIRSVREAGLPRGTSVRIDRLFFNTPARRKFLRGESTELGHALRWLTRYALSHPSRRFRLAHGGRQVLDTAPCETPLDRVAQIYGRELAGKLLPFDHGDGESRVFGFAGRPVDALPRRHAQHFFVNGRAVQDRLLAHAVSQAFGNTMAAGRHPAVFVFIELPDDTVDVNVHPQKTEVRFRHSGRVHDQVRAAVAGALADAGAVPSLAELRPGGRPELAGVRAAALHYVETREAGPSYRPAPPGRATGSAPAGTLPDVPPRDVATGSLLDAAGEDASRAVPLAQFNHSYIVAQDLAGLLLVDQHAAHERVLFENYLAAAENDRVETQRLMFPVTVELAADEAAFLEDELDEFKRLGFEIEPFGDRTVRLETIPAVAGEIDPERLFRELLGEATEARSAVTDVAQLRRRLITTAACHAAIKINHPLGREEMQGLLDDLYRANNPTTCPHGRPSIFRLTVEEIERAFRRR